MLGVALPIPVALKGLGQRLLVQSDADERHILSQPVCGIFIVESETPAGLLQVLQGLRLVFLLARAAVCRQSSAHGWSSARKRETNGVVVDTG